VFTRAASISASSSWRLSSRIRVVLGPSLGCVDRMLSVLDAPPKTASMSA
jgi:hypothetical protein